LIVDDVADTGETYHVIVEHIKERFPAEVRTAVLQYKTCSSFIPDYWGEKHDAWKWIIYPWALYEDMTGFIRRILIRPMTAEEVRKRLKSGFDIKITRKNLNEFLNYMRVEESSGNSKMAASPTGKEKVMNNGKQGICSGFGNRPRSFFQGKHEETSR